MERYGAWLVLQQCVSYLSLFDFQAMGTLKYKLSLVQHDPDMDAKRRLVGTALRLWLYLLPIWIPVTLCLVWYSPILVPLPEAEWHALKIAFAISAFSIILGRVLSLPANILRGMNEDFRVVLPSSAVILLGGVLNVIAVESGYGLPGLALTVLASSLLTSSVEFTAVKKHCSWFGSARPAAGELSSFLSLSSGVFINSLLLLGLLSSDVILASFLISPSDAAILGITGAALRMLVEPFLQLLAAGNSGILGLAGKREWKRLAAIRGEQQIVAVGLVGFLGAGIVLLNGPFVSLWLGPAFYGGVELSLALVLLTLFTALARTDAMFLLAIRKVNDSSWLSAIALVTSLGAAYVGAQNWGLNGLIMGLTLGRFMMYLGQGIVVRQFLTEQAAEVSSRLPRVLLASSLVVGISWFLAPRISVQSWTEFCLLAALCGLVSTSLLIFMGYSRSDRKLFLTRFKSALGPRAWPRAPASKES